jgi:hypothetical protein
VNVTQRVLVAAKARISDPAKWTKGACARNADGDTVDIYDRRACQWCSMGAILAALPPTLCISFVAAAMRPAVNGEWFVTWQDKPERTHAEVMAAFDRAEVMAAFDRAIKAAA